MKYIKWLFTLIAIGVILIALSEIMSYLNNPDTYMLGSEAMVGNGGIYYRSEIMVFLINAMQIIVSLFAIFLLFKSKGEKVLFIALLLVLLQIALFATT